MSQHTFEPDHDTDASQRLHEKAQDVFPGGVSHNIRQIDPYPIYIERSDDQHLIDVDGNPYVDFWNNHGASLLGHAPQSVVEAVQEQASDGLHYGAVNDPAVELARRALDYLPGAETFRFCVTGTEATMYAVRLARAYTGNDHVLKVEGGWHGGNTELAHAVHAPFDEPTTNGLPPGPAEYCHAFPLNDEAATTAIERSQRLKSELAEIEDRADELETRLEELLLAVPNVPQGPVPPGDDEAENEEVE